MSREARVVDTEHGKEVRRPYRPACQDYVLGWMLAFAIAAMLFLSIATHKWATPAISHTAATFTWVFWSGMVVLFGVRKWRPVAFYELMER